MKMLTRLLSRHLGSTLRGCFVACFLPQVALATEQSNTLLEVQRLDPSVVGRSIFFGVDTAIDGNLAGAVSWGFGSVESSVNLYDRRTGAQLSHIPLSASSNSSRFSSIDISGDRMVAGSQGLSSEVLLYDISNPLQPVEIMQLTSPGAEPFSNFGAAIEFQEEKLLVGAYGGSSLPGAAYLFDLTDTNEVEVTTLQPSVPSSNELFGIALSMNDEVAIVGGFAGKVYLFDLETGVELKAFTSPHADYREFGKSVDIFGDRAIVWSRQLNTGDDNGAAHVYDISDPTDPVLLATLTGDVPLLEKGFQGRVALEGDFAMLTARSANLDGVGSVPGAAYLFDISDLDNVRQTRLRPSDGWFAAEFGISLDMDGSNVIVGSWRQTVQGTDAGAAYVFQVPEPSSLGLLVLATLWVPRRFTRHRLS